MEKYLFAAFRSREHSVKFYEKLKSMRIPAIVINTPKEAEVGCGLSVRFSERYKSAVKTALVRTGYSSFIGIFEVVQNNGRKYVTSAKF